MWSRFARPYAITVLLTVLCIAAIWRWRTERSRRLAACAAITAALATWFHPSLGPFRGGGMPFRFSRGRDARRRSATSSFEAIPRAGFPRRLRDGTAARGAAHRRSAVAVGQGGGDRPGWEAIERLFAVIWGGVPTPAVAGACAVAAWGLVTLFRRDRRFAAYLAMLGLFPGILLWLSGAVWMQQGQNFLRYQLPVEPLVLFLGCVGATSLLRACSRRHAEAVAWSGAAVIAAAYLAATPTIAQVLYLGPWYGDPEYHWDYRHRWMDHKMTDPGTPRPPAFYAHLASLEPGSAPIIEAPFVWNGFLTPYAFYARFHRQPEKFGMMYDLCLTGLRLGDVPNDRRFRFRKFVALDDKAAVMGSGARYLLLNRRPPVEQVGSQYDDARCLPRVKALYGEPIAIDDRLAVFRLRP
jgi:hypothetical protein